MKPANNMMGYIGIGPLARSPFGDSTSVTV